MTKAAKRLDQHDIRAAIRRSGWTLTGIARAAGLEESACRVALIRRHRAGERAIAEHLSMSPAELWPERYPSSSHRETTPTRGAAASPESCARTDRRRVA